MKLVLYKDSISEIMEGLKDVEVDGNNVTWHDGSLKGINADFILIDDDVKGTLEEMISLDRKDEFQKVDIVAELRKENEQLKTDNEMNALAIMELTQFVYGGK